MDGQTNYIVFLCYGNQRVFYECTYALLSLSRLYKPSELNNTELWIYTDKPEWFRSLKECPLPLHYRAIDKETIKQWRGKIDFVHRVKVEMLRDFTKDKTGNILYADTDVVFTHRIDKMLEEINSGELYMHIMEAVINQSPNPFFKKMNKHFHKRRYREINGTPLYEMAMWNAGVIGFNTKYKHLAEDVLAFTDIEYPKFPKHVVEQFAFSVYFQMAGAVKTASPYIFHYWKLKEASGALASFFNYFKDNIWEELTRYSALLQMHAMMQQKVDFYHNRSIIGTLVNKQWQPEKPDWAMLVTQL